MIKKYGIKREREMRFSTQKPMQKMLTRESAALTVKLLYKSKTLNQIANSVIMNLH